MTSLHPAPAGALPLAPRPTDAVYAQELDHALRAGCGLAAVVTALLAAALTGPGMLPRSFAAETPNTQPVWIWSTR